LANAWQQHEEQYEKRLGRGALKQVSLAWCASADEGSVVVVWVATVHVVFSSLLAARTPVFRQSTSVLQQGN
jgi:hypothetical protein